MMVTIVQGSPARPSTDGAAPGPAITQTSLREQDAQQRSIAERDKGSGDFSDYLNQTSLTTVEKVKPPHRLDAADMVSQSSVYVAPTLFSA